MATDQTWEERKDRIRSGELLDVLRVRTPMYIGSRKLSDLSGFLTGWALALEVYGIESFRPLPIDFHDWVAYRLHFRESTSGYKNMILTRVPDEYAAVDRFYELLDEYRARQPRVVAKVNQYQGRTDVSKVKPDVTQEPVPRPDNSYTLRLIAYTDDPGFFVAFDVKDPTVRRSGTFYPLLSWFERRFGVNKQALEVLEPDTFKNWIRDDQEYKFQLTERLNKIDAERER